VLFHRAPGPVGITGQDGPDDAGVLDVRVLEVAPEHGDGVEQVDQLHPGLDHARGQHRRARRVGDGQVQPGVGRAVAGRAADVHGGQAFGQALPLLHGQARPGRHLGRAGLHHPAERQRVVELGAHVPRGPGELVVHHRLGLTQDKGAAEPAALGLDVPGGGQFAQRFSQGDTADAEPAGEFPLRRQPVTGRVHAQLDAFQQPLDGLLEGIARAHRAEHRRGDSGRPSRHGSYLLMTRCCHGKATVMQKD